MDDQDQESIVTSPSVVAPPRAPVPPMSPEIAQAIVQVMLTIEEPQRTGYNSHSDYYYATVDDVLAASRPCCAKNNLIIYPVEVSQHLHEIDGKHGKVKVADFVYEFILIHGSGAMWQHPYDQKNLRIQWTGPQTSGAAKSYAEKEFVKALFQLSTGERDADDAAQEAADDFDQTPKRRGRPPAQVVTSPANGERPAPPPLVTKKKPEAQPATPTKDDF